MDKRSRVRLETQLSDLILSGRHTGNSTPPEPRHFLPSTVPPKQRSGACARQRGERRGAHQLQLEYFLVVLGREQRRVALYRGDGGDAREARVHEEEQQLGGLLLGRPG